MSETALEPSGSSTSVFQLFSPALLPATLMLGGGMTISAVESYITATIAPSIVRDVGGLELFLAGDDALYRRHHTGFDLHGDAAEEYRAAQSLRDRGSDLRRRQPALRCAAPRCLSC